MDSIKFSSEFAKRAHRDQLYGERPYAVHLEHVAQLVAPLRAAYASPKEAVRRREQRMVIAYLHDTIEDTPVTHQLLAVLFGLYIADCVHLLSDPEGDSRKERKQLLYERFQEHRGDHRYIDSVTVKVADRLANVTSSIDTGDKRLKMYQKEHPEFRRQLHHAGMCDSLWEPLDYAIKTGERKRENDVLVQPVTRSNCSQQR